jgi:peroxiredoxin
MDAEADLKKFADSEKLGFTLLADVSGDITKAFGVPQIRAGLPSRVSFLVQEGKIAWVNPKVEIAKHFSEVLAEVTKLQEAKQAAEEKKEQKSEETSETPKTEKSAKTNK